MFITCTYLYQNHTSNAKNTTVDESVSIVKNLRYTDLKRCNVILDVENGIVIKCRNFKLYDDVFTNSLNGPDYQRLLDYFQSHHPKEIGMLLDAINSIKNLNVVEEKITIGI